MCSGLRGYVHTNSSRFVVKAVMSHPSEVHRSIIPEERNGGRIAALWHLMTEPPDTVKDSERRRQMRFKGMGRGVGRLTLDLENGCLIEAVSRVEIEIVAAVAKMRVTERYRVSQRLERIRQVR